MMFSRWLLPTSLLLSSVNALTFNPIVGGPFTPGTKIPVSWTLDGTEPLGAGNAWNLFFLSANGTLAAQFGDITASVQDAGAGLGAGAGSVLVAFPGFDGRFQGRVGNTVLATSTLVNVEVAADAGAGDGLAQTGGFGSAPSATKPNNLAGPSKSASSTPSAAAKSKGGLLLGIVLAIVVVLLLLLAGGIVFCMRRRRRVQQEAEKTQYPFASGYDAEKQLDVAAQIDPFQSSSSLRSDAKPVSYYPEVHIIPPSSMGSASAGTSLASGSRDVSPLPSPLPSLAPQRGPPRGKSIAQVHMARNGAPVRHTLTPTPRAPSPSPSLPLPALPPSAIVAGTLNGAGDSRRTAYLNSQLQKLELSSQQAHIEDPERDENGSMVFNPLSSVPSETTYAGGDQTSPTSPPLGRRDYLSQQLARLENPRRVSGTGSVVFTPLSRAPSARTLRPIGEVPPLPNPYAAMSPASITRLQPFAYYDPDPEPVADQRRSVHTFGARSPLEDPYASRPSISDVLSPAAPAPYVPPW